MTAAGGNRGKSGAGGFRARRALARLRQMPRPRLLALAVVLIGAGLSIWAFVAEPASLRNEDYELSPARWPAECDGLEVALLSDLHVGSPFNGMDKLASVVALTQRAEPDVVLLAGDYVIHDVMGGSFTPPERIAAALGKLRAPAGVWAVLGNHEHWYDAPRVTRAFENAGIRVLSDAAVKTSAGACSFWVVGISDFHEGRHDVAGAMRQVSDAAPVLAFTHNPDLFPSVPARVNLTLAGHTHGGQVYIPFIGRPIVPSDYGERYAIGHVVEEGRDLFVTSGVGTSILPVRFLVPPEISVLTLRAAGAGRLDEGR